MLIDVLRARLGDASAASFQLMGEDLQLLGLAEVHAALAQQLAALPAALRTPLVAEEAALASEAHAWLRRYNRSLYGRIAGYVALGERLAFRYPWPVVAVLGIVQVLGGMDRARIYGLVGRIATRLGVDRYERLGDGSEDVLRRTNRGIFADSVPLVLRALRAEQLRADGQGALADALVAGSAALLWDAESAALCRALVDGLALGGAAGFAALAATTRQHFAREQAIFTHHMATRSRRPLPRARSVPAPVVERDRRGARLVFRPYPLPPDFDLRDHAARVAVFGEAFVRSVTRSEADYGVATAWVRAHFGGSRGPQNQRRASGIPGTS